MINFRSSHLSQNHIKTFINKKIAYHHENGYLTRTKLTGSFMQQGI